MAPAGTWFFLVRTSLILSWRFRSSIRASYRYHFGLPQLDPEFPRVRFVQPGISWGISTTARYRCGSKRFTGLPILRTASATAPQRNTGCHCAFDPRNETLRIIRVQGTARHPRGGHGTMVWSPADLSLGSGERLRLTLHGRRLDRIGGGGLIFT